MTWFKYITKQIFDFNTSPFPFFFPNLTIFPSSCSFKFMPSLVTNCYCMHLCIDMCIYKCLFFYSHDFICMYIFTDNLLESGQPVSVHFPGEEHISCFQLSAVSFSSLCRVRGLLDFPMLLECTFLPSMFRSHLEKHIQIVFVDFMKKYIL